MLCFLGKSVYRGFGSFPNQEIFWLTIKKTMSHVVLRNAVASKRMKVLKHSATV